MDRPTRFVVACAFAASEEEAAAPQVVAQTRQRTADRRGVPCVIFQGNVATEFQQT